MIANVTVTQPKAGGYLTVYPGGAARPGTSNLNFMAGQTVANLVVTGVGGNGSINIYNGSSGTVQIIVDVSAWNAPGTGTISWGAPRQIDAVQGHPNSISCPTPTFSAAVDSGGDVVTYNGSTWSPPAPIDPDGGGINSVSCPTTSFCAGVDASGDAVIYDGTTWSAPARIERNGDGLGAVSCATISFCIATSDHGDVITYDGTGWSSPAPNDVGAESLSARRSAFAAATFEGGSTLMTFDGTSWSPHNLPPGQGWLTGVSCATSTFCLAVAPSGQAAEYDGATFYGIGGPPGLSTVSCASSTFCVAGDPFGNAVTYDGSTWTAPANIDPGGNALTSLSCPTTTFCAAVDATGNAVTYNGTTWTGPTFIDPAGGSPAAVSCPTTTFCLAVDGAGDAISYNGTTWSTPTTTPIDRYGGGLTAVSCPTTNFCAAVDRAGNALHLRRKVVEPPRRHRRKRRTTRLGLLSDHHILPGGHSGRRLNRLHRALVGRTDRNRSNRLPGPDLAFLRDNDLLCRRRQRIGIHLQRVELEPGGPGRP